MKRYSYTVWCCLVGFSAIAQPADTTFTLPEFEKLDLKFDQVRSIAQTTLINNSVIEFNRAGNITDLLESATTLFVRNYGPGYSAGVSQRGLATAHTPIYWRGINLNAPSTGIADVSLIPAAFIQSMAIVNGGASAAAGSGILGGGIYLNPNYLNGKDSVSTGIELRTTNTQNFETTAFLSLQKKGWRVNTIVFNNESANKYQYINNTRKDHPKERRQNAGFGQKGWLQQIEKQIGNHIVNLSFWGVETNRQLAPGLTSGITKEHQTDFNLKAVASIDLNFQQLNGTIQTGWLNDELFYFNSFGFQSVIKTQQWLLSADFKQKLSENTVLCYGTNNSSQWINTGMNYPSDVQQLSLAVYAGINQLLFKKRLNANLLLRQEYFQHYENPLSPALSLTYRIGKQLSIFARGSRNYRIPGLNDRFWQPGGNVDLPPERSWSAELGPALNHLLSRGKIEIGANVFGFIYHVDNWIQWIPGAEYWYVVSYKTVRSAGLQSELHCNLKLKDFNIRAALFHNYVDSKNLESSVNPQISGTNLLHTPSQKLVGNLSVIHKNTTLMIDGNYTGSRFTTSDNYSQQPAFMVFNVAIGQSFQFKKIGTVLKFRVHNLLNEDYQVMPYMPMPLRYYSISAQFNFISKLNLKR